MPPYPDQLLDQTDADNFYLSQENRDLKRRIREALVLLDYWSKQHAYGDAVYFVRRTLQGLETGDNDID